MQITDFVPNYSFRVDFLTKDKLVKDISFTKVGGISFKINPSDTDDNDSGSSLGEITLDELSLERYFTKGDKTHNIKTWLNDQLSENKKNPITVIVHSLNSENKSTVSWTFFNAYFTSYKLSEFDSKGNDLVTESLTLKYTHFKRENAS